MREKWGFNYIFINFGYPYDICLAAGYQPDHMLGGGLNPKDPGSYVNAVTSRPTLWGYYVDEPISQQKSTQFEFQVMSSFFSTNYPNSIFTIGETTVFYAYIVHDLVDMIACTRYCIDGDKFCIYPDQRQLWSDFNTQFGSKFNMGWVGAHKDLGDYDIMIERANQLGFTNLWLYQANDLTDAYSDNNVSTFSHFAWKWGWLKKVERKWIYTYQCINQNPCDCDPNTLGTEWILINKYSTSETRTLTY